MMIAFISLWCLSGLFTWIEVQEEYGWWTTPVQDLLILIPMMCLGIVSHLMWIIHRHKQ